MNIELYLVKSSSGSYEDYNVCNEKVVYATLEAAEKRRDEIIAYHNRDLPFPFDWCTEEQFRAIMESNEADAKDLDRYTEWQGDLYEADDFNACWIEIVVLDQQSWRDRQLDKIEKTL